MFVFSVCAMACFRSVQVFVRVCVSVRCMYMRACVWEIRRTNITRSEVRVSGLWPPWSMVSLLWCIPGVAEVLFALMSDLGVVRLLFGVRPYVMRWLSGLLQWLVDSSGVWCELVEISCGVRVARSVFVVYLEWT